MTKQLNLRIFCDAKELFVNERRQLGIIKIQFLIFYKIIYIFARQYSIDTIDRLQVYLFFFNSVILTAH